MNYQTIEELYEEHLKNEPKKWRWFDKKLDMGMHTDAWFSWKIEKENLELVKTIPKDKRIEALELLKKGKTCGEVARELGIENHMAVFYLIHYNIKKVLVLRSESI